MSLSTDDKIREYVMKKAQQREHARQLREARKSLAKQDSEDIIQNQYPAATKDSLSSNGDTSSHYSFWGKDETSRVDVGTRVAPAKTFTNSNRTDNGYAGISAVSSHVRTSIGLESMNMAQPSPKYATMEDLEKVKSFFDQLQGQMHSLQFQIDNLKYSNQRLSDQVAFWQREATENSARCGNLKGNLNNNNNNVGNNSSNNMQSDVGYGSSYGSGFLQSRNAGQQPSPSLQNSNNNNNNNPVKSISVDTRGSKANGDNFYGNNNANTNVNNNNSGNNSSSNLFNRNRRLSSQNTVGDKTNQNNSWSSNSNNNNRNNGAMAMDIDSRSEAQQVNDLMKGNNKNTGRPVSEFRPFGSNNQNSAEGSNAPAFTFQSRESSGSKLALHEPMDTSTDKLPVEEHNFREQESDAENQTPMTSSSADLLAKLGPDAFPDPQSNEEKVECPQCSRKFSSESALEKHVKACMKKRKTFDASKMRMDEEALKAKVETEAATDKNKKSEKWKNQSGALREAIKAAREYNQAKKEGREPPPPAQSTVPDTRVGCPYCGRKFNEDAAERHIPKCKNIKSKPKPLGKK